MSVLLIEQLSAGLEFALGFYARNDLRGERFAFGARLRLVVESGMRFSPLLRPYRLVLTGRSNLIQSRDTSGFAEKLSVQSRRGLMVSDPSSNKRWTCLFDDFGVWGDGGLQQLMEGLHIICLNVREMPHASHSHPSLQKEKG